MDAITMRGGWGEAEIVWFESGCVICRAADHAEATGHPCRWDVLRPGLHQSILRSLFKFVIPKNTPARINLGACGRSLAILAFADEERKRNGAHISIQRQAVKTSREVH